MTEIKDGKAETFQLPDGTTTTDPQVLCDAWRDFSKPICNMMGWVPFGYDPGVMFRDKGRSIDLPCDLIQKINELIARPERGIDAVELRHKVLKRMVETPGPSYIIKRDDEILDIIDEMT